MTTSTYTIVSVDPGVTALPMSGLAEALWDAGIDTFGGEAITLPEQGRVFRLRFAEGRRVAAATALKAVAVAEGLGWADVRVLQGWI